MTLIKEVEKLSEFIKGANWSDLSYREILNQLAASRKVYVEKYIDKQTKHK